MTQGMTRVQKNHSQARLPALLFATALLAPFAAQSATISAGAAVEVGVADTDFDPLFDALNANTDSTSTDDSIYSYSDEFNEADGAYSGAAANQDGWMYSYSGGDNTFKAASHVQQSLTVTNDTGVDQNYSFDFTILQGSLSAGAYGAYGEDGYVSDNYETGEFAGAAYLVSITLDGVELFGSEALLVADEDGHGLETGGTDLGGSWIYPGYYRWDAFSDTLNLGTFAAGESFTLTYDIYTAAAGVFDGSGYGDGDEGCYIEEIETEYCGGDWSSAYAQFGDPNGVYGSPIAGNLHRSPVSVPEPGLWLLMGTGLFALAIARRRVGRS